MDKLRVPTPNDGEQPERLMTVGDLSTLLQVPPATIYAWRYKGIGPIGLRVGKHLRFRPSDVRTWIQMQVRDD